MNLLLVYEKHRNGSKRFFIIKGKCKTHSLFLNPLTFLKRDSNEIGCFFGLTFNIKN